MNCAYLGSNTTLETLSDLKLGFSEEAMVTPAQCLPGTRSLCLWLHFFSTALLEVLVGYCFVLPRSEMSLSM